VPFIVSFEPSARAKAAGAPVEVEIGKVEPGQLITVEWRGKVCWVLNRTKPQLDRCPSSTCGSPIPTRTCRTSRVLQERAPLDQGQLLDRHRHLHAPRVLADVSSGDRARRPRSRLARRLLLPVPPVEVRPRRPRVQGRAAPTNLVIPPHKYLSDTKIVIGVGQDGKES
jgi:ubiquinol-cytochrome c reductase iron-sulfur subunit